MRQEDPRSFIVNLARRIKSSSKITERQLVNASVILRKRLRDLNDDDRTGVYSPRTGNWVTIDLSGIYSWNIVKPTIRANTSSMVTANVRVDIKPKFIKDANAEMASQVCNALIEQVEREQWTYSLEEYLANEVQLGAGVFVRAFHNPNKIKKRSLPKWEDVEVASGGVAVCPQCGHETMFEEVGGVQCEQCGSPAVIEQEPQQGTIPVPTGYEEFTAGSCDTAIYPFWEFRIDTERTQGGNLQNARWFEHHYIASLDELEIEYPESAEKMRGQGNELSYPLRWQLTLSSGRTTPTDFGDEFPVEPREVRDIWVTPAMYLNVELTDDLKLKDANGKVRFAVKKGKTFADGVFEGEKFDEPPVLCFRIVGDELVDIFPSDFREEFFYVTFLSNPSTFWGLFATELVTLQDIVNYMLTIQMYHIRRNAITSIVYNRGSFDPEAFEEDLIPTKQDIPPDIPIASQFGIIPALTLSQEPMQMLQSVMAAKGDITQVQPAMVGEAQPGQPYAAQLLQKQSSLGMLSAASLSKAQAKVGWAKKQLKTIQEYWTDEDTEELLRLNGEWSEDFVKAFLECDVCNDLIIDFVAGSEIPTTLIEREAKLRQTLTDLIQLGSVDPSFVKPETLNEILTEILQAGGIDIDVNNTESDLRLAESRYDKLLEKVRSNPDPVQDLAANQMIAQQIISQPMFQPMPFEGHQVIIEFWSDKIRQEAAKDDPDYLLLACLQGLIALQMNAQVQQGQMMMQQQMAIQQPVMEQQMAMQAQQVEAEGQANAQAQEAEMVNRQMDREDAEAEREFQREMRAVDMMESEEERKLKRDTERQKAKVKGK